jgi:hypothetical protein
MILKKHSMVLAILLLSGSLFGQDEVTYEQYNKEQTIFDVKIGAGSGAKYGGWGGFCGEFDIGYVGIMAAAGFILPNSVVKNTGSSENLSEFGWQAGLKIYFVSNEYKARPSLNLLIGNLFPYYINFTNYTKRGKYIGITPSLIIEHDIGKPDGLSLSYGLGVVLHQQIPEKDASYFKKGGSNEIIIRLSPIFGINYCIISKKKKQLKIY